MSLEQLLVHVGPGQRPEVERRYAAFAREMKTLGDGHDAHIDSFAKVLSEDGLITADGLQEFLTYRGLKVSAGDFVPDPNGSRYEAMTLLGRGGMGEVFLGTEPALRRTVAIKRLHAQDPIHLRRFVTEAQVTAQLDHPAIMPIYGFERADDGALSYAMKFVRGVTLTALIEAADAQIKANGRPDHTHTLKARVATFVPVLQALAYAHRRGVLHRDLKPDNIMVGRFGEVIVLDWGIARLMGSDLDDAVAAGPAVRAIGTPQSARANTLRDTAAEGSSDGLTRVGAVIGTPDFMSPEQARGERLDAAADQCALGLILQEIATRKPALRGRSSDAVLERAKKGERAAIVESGEKIPRELRAIIAKATAFDKHARYASVEAMAEDVQRYLRDESVLAAPDSGAQRATRWVGNHRGTALAMAAGTLCLLLAVLAISMWRGEVTLEAQRQAARTRERNVMQLSASVEARAKHMTEQLHRYEKLLAELATAARIYLSEPATPSNIVVYKYRDGQREPLEIPSEAIDSPIYGQVTSLRHADFSAAPDVDRQEMRQQIDQIARLEPLLRATLLASADPDARALSIGRAEHLVLQVGVPLVWAYFATESGLSVGMPGTWKYEESPGTKGYDHRKESWYRDALATRKVDWSSGVDENGLGILLGAAQVVRDDDGKILGVAAIDLAMRHLIDTYLDIPELAAMGAEALLIDKDGKVQVRSSQKAVARVVTEFTPVLYEEPAVLAAMKAAELGHIALPDGRIAFWSALGRVGLTYVVIGAETALVAPSAQP